MKNLNNETKRLILESAEKLIAEKSYSKLQRKEVANKAGFKHTVVFILKIKGGLYN